MTNRKKSNIQFQKPQEKFKNLPVLVWIYGGAFVAGNSSSNFYGIDNIIEEDLILVTFNYRVGLFGKYFTDLVKLVVIIKLKTFG